MSHHGNDDPDAKDKNENVSNGASVSQSSKPVDPAFQDVAVPLGGSTTEVPTIVSRPDSANDSAAQEAKVASNKTESIDDPVAMMELNKLSEDARQVLIDEVNGRAIIEEENLEVVQQNLDIMNSEIESLRHRAASAYNLATFLAPRDIKERNFRLMFLRGEQFDARKAAKRMIKHFEYKLRLFGEDKVAKNITLDDFNEEDRAALMSGSVQCLPCTDTSGRAIIWFGTTQAKFKSYISELRALWYTMMSALENPNAQRRGLVLIIYAVGGCHSDGASVTELLMNSYLVKDGVPATLAAIHCCFNDERSRPCLSLLKSVGGTDFRLRYREHKGSHQECQIELANFGMARGILPVDNRGIYWNEDLNRLVEARKKKEEQEKQEEKESNFVRLATNKDVLFGRGKPFQEHVGNLNLARLIEARQHEYMNANRVGKTSISFDIVKSVHDDSGSFLKRHESSGMWELVSDMEARDKVAHGFRTKTRSRETRARSPVARKKPKT